MSKTLHAGPWAVYADAQRQDLSELHETYEQAKLAANSLGCRYVSNGIMTYYRGADSFWYQWR